MSDNPFEKLTKSMNQLAETLENNTDVIADRIRKKKQAQQLADGEITAEEAFAQDVQYAKGEMMSEYCTHCGASIRMHQKLTRSYCRTCGHEIELNNARSGKYEESAIAQMDSDLLYTLSQVKKYNRDTLLRAAAKKGSIPANRDLALAAVFDEEYDEALPYAKFGKKNGDPECSCCVLACEVCKKKPRRAEDALNTLHKIKKADLRTEKGKELYSMLENALEEYRQEQREDERRQKAAYHASIAEAVYRRMNEPKLESAIWRDFRTGEQLYRRSTDGKIVNGSGQEVSSAWWE